MIFIGGASQARGKVYLFQVRGTLDGGDQGGEFKDQVLYHIIGGGEKYQKGKRGGGEVQCYTHGGGILCFQRGAKSILYYKIKRVKRGGRGQSKRSSS